MPKLKQTDLQSSVTVGQYQFEFDPYAPTDDFAIEMLPGMAWFRPVQIQPSAALGIRQHPVILARPLRVSARRHPDVTAAFFDFITPELSNVEKIESVTVRQATVDLNGPSVFSTLGLRDLLNSESWLGVRLDSSWALHELDRLRMLDENWDSYGGRAPTRQSVDVAAGLIFAMEIRYSSGAGDRVAPYDVAPIPRGGVQVEWRGPRAFLEVEVGPNGDLSYLKGESDSLGHGLEERHDVAPSEVQEMLDRVLAN